jgi:hypothetical protein
MMGDRTVCDIQRRGQFIIVNVLVFGDELQNLNLFSELRAFATLTISFSVFRVRMHYTITIIKLFFKLLKQIRRNNTKNCFLFYRY